MENKLNGTTDIYTVCTNESILTIDDKTVGENIQPFAARCKLTGKPCTLSPMPLSAIAGVNSSEIWNNYAQPFGDIDERILIQGSFFFCFIGMTKVEIADPAQYDVRVGDSHKIYEIPEITNWNITNGFIDNDPNITNSRVPALEHGNIGNITDIVLHRTVTSDVPSTLTSFGSGVGTHFLIGTDGTILQTASLDQITWHAGRRQSDINRNPGRYPHETDLSYYNLHSIGIEVVGQPLDANDNITRGHEVGDPRVVSWQELSPEQEAAVAYLTNNLINHYGLNSGNVQVHEDIAPKTDGEGQTVYNAIVDDITPVNPRIECEASHVIDDLLRLNDAESTGELIAVDGALISCPNAIPPPPRRTGPI